MTRSWRTLAVVLVFSLTPGAAEAVENVVHLAHDGHLAHAATHDDDHAPEGDEHGCNSVFHACACHATVSFLVRPAGPVGLTTPSVPTLLAPDDEASRASDGVAPGLFRPPIR